MGSSPWGLPSPAGGRSPNSHKKKTKNKKTAPGIATGCPNDLCEKFKRSRCVHIV